MLTHLSPWQKVPSGQGVALRLQGALIPIHSLAAQEDISFDILSTGDINPSEQKPPLHFWPTGQESFAIQGSLAAIPITLPIGTFIRGLDGFSICTTTSAIRVNATASPNPVNPINPVIVAILSDVVSEKAQ